MTDLWLEIYSHLMECDNDAIKMQNTIHTEMERLLVPYKNTITDEENEKLRCLLYDVINATQKEAIMYGIKLIMKSMLKL